jgi:uncharacterized surface protein with fasciclin (FAS1) repeats
VDIVETAVKAGTFNTLAAALTEAGLVATLKGAGPFTVFAPSDDAFKKLPSGTVDKLLKNKSALTRVLTFHVVSGNVSSGEVVKMTSVKTLEGGSISVGVKQASVYLGEDAKVVGADVKASNGVIHVIDHVLLPPNLNL